MMARIWGSNGKPLRMVPLSQFFLDQDAQRKPGPEDVTGLVEKPAKKKSGKSKKGTPGAQSEAGVVAGSPALTGTWNVATYPIPVGAGDGRAFIDYAPGHPLGRKKKKRAELPVLRRK